MATPIPSREQSPTRPLFPNTSPRSSEADRTVVNEPEQQHLQHANHKNRLAATNTYDSSEEYYLNRAERTRTYEENDRLKDDLTMLQAERVATQPDPVNPTRSTTAHRSRSRVEPVDAFDADTNPIHERMANYKPVEHPTTGFAKFFKRVQTSFWLLRYIVYIVPVTVLLLIPLLVGVLLPQAQKACVGGVELVWFSVWLQIVWLTLWGGRVAAKIIPWPLGVISSLFTNNPKKWRDLGKALEVPVTVFFWVLAIEISFLPTMNNHHCDGNKSTLPWEDTMNSIIISLFVGVILNLIVKLILQLVAINFHLRTFDDRIEVNKFQIRCLEKLYTYSKKMIAMEDSEFEDRPSGPASGARTPAMYVEKAQKVAQHAFAKVGDVTGAVAGDFTGKTVSKSSHPHQVVITLLHSVESSQVLARRLYRTFARPDAESIFSDDLKNAFEDQEEADAAFTMFDKDMNGDISRKELESVCAEIGQERKAITASLKDLGSVVSKLGSVLFFIIIVVTMLVFITLISTSAAGVLTSAGSAVLALSWLFSATAQEFLQSVVFVFVKHPFDVNDRVTIYGNTGSLLHGDDYFVKKISLLYTEFKKMEGHIVQAPNSYLNTLFILNMRRSGGLAEAVPIAIKFGTTIDQINGLRDKLLEFVKSEKREFQPNILTELRDVTEAYSVTLNVVFFYKSNWQNELLRLTRRNSFICAMMLAMQELGIEGPRSGLPGAKEQFPWFVQNLTTRDNQYISPARAADGAGPNKPKQIVTGSAPVDEDVREDAVTMNMETIREVNERGQERNTSLTSEPTRSSTDSQGGRPDRRVRGALRGSVTSTDSRSPRRFMSRLGRKGRRSESLEMTNV